MGKDVNNLKKFFYVFGIYAFCVEIHRTFRSMPKILDNAKTTARQIRQINDIIDGKETEKEEIGFRPKKVVNRIGF